MLLFFNLPVSRSSNNIILTIVQNRLCRGERTKLLKYEKINEERACYCFRKKKRVFNAPRDTDARQRQAIKVCGRNPGRFVSTSGSVARLDVKLFALRANVRSAIFFTKRKSARIKRQR